MKQKMMLIISPREARRQRTSSLLAGKLGPRVQYESKIGKNTYSVFGK
jgi:hypothetical protein